MTREEQIEVATATYINGRLRNNVPPEEIEEIRLAYQAGAIYADEHPDNPYKDVIAHMSSNTYRVWKQNLWHDAPKELPDCECVCVTYYNGGYHINVWNPYYRTWDDSEGDDCEFDNNKELDWMVLKVEEEQDENQTD